MAWGVARRPAGVPVAPLLAPCVLAASPLPALCQPWTVQCLPLAALAACVGQHFFTCTEEIITFASPWAEQAKEETKDLAFGEPKSPQKCFLIKMLCRAFENRNEGREKRDQGASGTRGHSVRSRRTEEQRKPAMAQGSQGTLLLTQQVRGVTTRSLGVDLGAVTGSLTPPSPPRGPQWH